MEAKITFIGCVQNSQELGTDNEHLVSKVDFSMEIDGTTYESLYATIKQTVGSDFDSHPLEVSRPIGYDGPFSQNKFQDEVDKYFRELIGKRGHAINVGKDAQITMKDNIILDEKKVIINW